MSTTPGVSSDKPRTGWMEEYKTCSCSNVQFTRADLPGYCQKHGTNRKHLYRMPKVKPEEVGYAGT